MADSTELDDIRSQLKAFETLLAGMASATGASSAMGVGGAPTMTGGVGGGFGGWLPQNQPQGTPANTANNTGYFAGPVGGPNSPLIAPSYAPSGVIFGGGSPFPVNPWPARINNSLVGLRDLMNTPLGQQLIAKLKARFAGGAGGVS